MSFHLSPFVATIFWYEVMPFDNYYINRQYNIS